MMNSEMTLMLLGLVVAASLIIGVVIVWGARNGTLRESEQERFERRFQRMVSSYHTSGSPRLP
jgi:hypothetical protein